MVILSQPLPSPPPPGSSFQPAVLAASFRSVLYNTSLQCTAQHCNHPGQKSSPGAKKDYRNYLVLRERWVQLCLSVFPKGQRNTFFIDTHYHSTPRDPRSIWIDRALDISVAELPAPLSTCCAASNKTPCLPKAVSGESFCYGVVQRLARQGLNSVLLPRKRAILTATTTREASRKQKSPQEKTYSSGTGSTNQKCLETGQ